MPLCVAAFSEEADSALSRRRSGLAHTSSQERLRQSLSSLGSETSLQDGADRPRSLYDNVLVTDGPQARPATAAPVQVRRSVVSGGPGLCLLVPSCPFFKIYTPPSKKMRRVKKGTAQKN